LILLDAEDALEAGGRVGVAATAAGLFVVMTMGVTVSRDGAAARSSGYAQDI
jgi:hypothetical protein